MMNTTIKLDNFHSGTYILKIQDTNTKQVFTYKIIVQ